MNPAPEVPTEQPDTLVEIVAFDPESKTMYNLVHYWLNGSRASLLPERERSKKLPA